jgi:outer membrane murein-binding lipoprotein Lpp
MKIFVALGAALLLCSCNSRLTNEQRDEVAGIASDAVGDAVADDDKILELESNIEDLESRIDDLEQRISAEEDK